LSLWWSGGLFLSALVLFTLWADYRIKKAYKALARKRPNLTKAEFQSQMQPEVSADLSAFLWDQILFYVKPILTPHPDDNLFLDLKIDEDDVFEDWVDEWAENAGYYENSFAHYPNDVPPTIKNFGIWLESAPVC
jgi:hypothetical protein